MKEDLSLYNIDYHQQFTGEGFQDAWNDMAAILTTVFPVARYWVDLGCGPGYLIDELARQMGKRGWCCGVELKRITSNYNASIYYQDLNRPVCPFHHRPLADIVMSFDVAEHLDTPESLILSCCNLSKDIVLFGAATPDQPGVGHINCKERDEWNRLFEVTGGYKPDDLLTLRLVSEMLASPFISHYIWWIPKNLVVYRRQYGKNTLYV